jgi:Ca2+-binding RTX toxin-like protein
MVGAGDTDRNIWVMNANGTAQAAIDINPAHDVSPDWRPIPVCTMRVNAGNDPLVGTAGADVLCGDDRANSIDGAGGDDIILGRGGKDDLTGGLGNDTVNGAGGSDTARFPGPDAVRADLATGFATGVGSDVLIGVDSLVGSSAADRLRGSAGANLLIGGQGADVLYGFDGADRLNSRDGVTGNDTVGAGGGADTCVMDATEASVSGCQ